MSVPAHLRSRARFIDEENDEGELVKRTARGDRDAFRVLVERHQRPLGAFARRMLNDRDAADDAVQETLLRLWTEAGRFEEGRTKLTTWLHSILRNLCIDSYRKTGRLSYGSDADATEGATAGPDDARDDRQRRDAVRAAISRLPERQRSALLLCHYQGFSNRAAAQILDVSVDAVESLLARARRTLKKELLNHDGS